MKIDSAGTETAGYWFVGSIYDGTADQTERFLQEGIWENGYEDKYLDTVRSIRPGDRIAIKASYTRKKNLPFNSRGNTASVMAIKAVGTVTENPGDGRVLKVDWQSTFDPPRQWYFYTNRITIWNPLANPADKECADRLIRFAFDGEDQDIDYFRNQPFWRERYGEVAGKDSRFAWTRFYEAVADRLLSFRERRDELLSGIYDSADKMGGLAFLQDQFADNTTGPLQDICPFTVMGLFNRGITDANRKAVATELAKLLEVAEPVPVSFAGVPILNNQKSWFFGFSTKRQAEDIDLLWDVFARAIAFARPTDVEAQPADQVEDDTAVRSAFLTAFDKATNCYGVGWNLTIGLFWTRPWNFPTLDSQSQAYIKKKLNIPVLLNGSKGRISANDYLAIRDVLEARFKETAYPVHSFPELSLAAYQFEDGGEVHVPPPAAYSVTQILEDGCFAPREKLETMLARLRTRKNIILQGPPGTGKSWLARRLAYALVGRRDDNKVRAVQFHPNLSYEDFVRGWRPAGEGRLSLVDGPFVEMIAAAGEEPDTRHVLVIEEINRGNPAQIFGEMLTLLEADKRTPSEALELSYRRFDGERVSIPDNLYVIGTMNIADRSLALVDLALRRRFAFIDLEPTLGEVWRVWVHDRYGVKTETLLEIEQRLTSLNSEIAVDTSLGKQFRVGHSYVTPPAGASIEDGREWFRQVVDTEIGPLLDEYWFDAPEKSRKARERLLDGF